MKCQIGIVCILLTACLSCSDQGRQKPEPTVPPASSEIKRVKPASSYSDTLVISQPSAVFYHPDSLQDLKIKAVTDSAIYKSSIHEIFYQMRYSRITLHKYYPSVKIIETKNIRYLLFKKAGGDAECIDLNTRNDAAGLFVFDGKQPARLVDMTNIETELGFYFKK